MKATLYYNNMEIVISEHSFGCRIAHFQTESKVVFACVHVIEV